MQLHFIRISGPYLRILNNAIIRKVEIKRMQNARRSRIKAKNANGTWVKSETPSQKITLWAWTTKTISYSRGESSCFFFLPSSNKVFQSHLFETALALGLKGTLHEFHSFIFISYPFVRLKAIVGDENNMVHYTINIF